jgi:glycosyltransferase involved in cell wall biosynthesis
MIIQAYYPIVGGAERQLATIAPLLVQRGIRVSIITRKRIPSTADYEVVDGIPVYRVPVAGPKFIASVLFTLRCLRVLRKLKPDILHAYELLSPTTTAALYKLIWRTPVVAKVLRGGSQGDLDVLKRNRFGSLRAGLTLRFVDMFIAISKEIQTELSQTGIPIGRQVWIPNGVDIERFQPVSQEQKQQLRQSLGLPSGFLAVFTGRLDPEKNIASLAAVWPSVQQSIPNAHLLVIGTGSQEKQIQDLACDHVHLLGKMADVVPYLQAADVFILPSSTEGLSNALLEALACGLPSIATAVGGNPELVIPEKTGFLVLPEDPQALQTAVLALAKNTAIREKMSANCRQLILDNYPLDRTVERLVEVYRRLTH